MTDMANGWGNSLPGMVLGYAFGINDENREALKIGAAAVASKSEVAVQEMKTGMEFSLVELIQIYVNLGLDTSALQQRFTTRIVGKQQMAPSSALVVKKTP